MTETSGAHPERDELDALAGEYVLGTLDADERRAAEARIAADPSFRRAVGGWQNRLQPLANAAGEAAPPGDMFHRIESRLELQVAPAGGNVVILRRALVRWRVATAVLAAAAASLVAVVVLDRMQPAPQSEFAAVLTGPDGTTPAFVATVDVRTRTIQLVRVASPAPAGKSYELWSIAPNAQPRSLGVVEQASYRQVIGDSPSKDITLAVTLEQKGGSPTGAPQGPIVFKGTLLPAQ
ncbi:anti-sigma factor [soil metagenome]